MYFLLVYVTITFNTQWTLRPYPIRRDLFEKVLSLMSFFVLRYITGGNTTMSLLVRGPFCM